MKYNQPFNTSDPTAAYVDGNPSAGEEGSIPRAGAIEFPQREIVNAIVAAGLTPTNADLTQLWQAMQAAGGQSQSALWHFGQDAGGANALVVNVSPNIANYSDGLVIATVAAANNTGASTINADSVGTAQIKRSDGSTLQNGDIVGGRLIVFQYDATGVFFRIMFQQQDSQAAVHFGTDTGAANTVTAAVSPPITGYILGSMYGLTILNDNTGASNANFNGLGNKPVVLNKTGGALTGSELKAGTLALLWYDGANMRLLNPAADTLLPAISKVTISGTFPVTPGIRKLEIEAWAAGGGGWTVVSGSNTAGDGGGGGEKRTGVFLTIPGTPVNITIGAAGAAGAPGLDGGDTIITGLQGGTITAKGGKRATGFHNAGPGAGGTGGAGGFGFDGFKGQGGFTGSGNENFSGPGGAAFGASLSGGPAVAGGNPGNFPGGGGQGGNGGGLAGRQIAGAGAAGLVIIRQIP